MGVYEALDYIRTKRRIARPNPGFMIQLVQFGKQIPEMLNVDAGSSLDVTIVDEYNVTNSIIQLTKSLQSTEAQNISV